MPRWGLILIVFLGSFLRLAYRADRVGLASGYVDPVGKIAAQDEAVYGHIALRMAADGEWLRPKFLGRLALFKPPLLYWAAAAAVRVRNESVLALRIPSLVAGAATATLLFAWIGGWPGLAASLLLLSDPLWHVLSRLCLTDALLALWIALAMRSLMTRNRNGFVLSTAAAILTKGIAGVIPLIAAALWWTIEPDRIPPRRWIWWFALPFLALSPWVATQLWLHPKWFWAEFVGVEILSYSLGAPPQTSTEHALWFYARRLILIDLPLLALAIVGATRMRLDSEKRVLIAWIAAVALAVAGNQYRNIAYVLPAIPALAWIAARAGSIAARWLVLVLAVVFVVRVAHPEQPWGISFPTGSTIADAHELTRYANFQRPAELIVVDPDDQFLATTLGLPKVRYAYFGSERDYRRHGLDFRELGIVLTIEEFETLGARESQYRQRLREWDLDSAEPIGAVILLKDASEIPRLRSAAPHADLLLRNPHRIIPRSD